MGDGHNCKLARSGAAQRFKLTVCQLASKMATSGCVARSPVLHRAGQKVAYSVSGYLVSCSSRENKMIVGLSKAGLALALRPVVTILGPARGDRGSARSVHLREPAHVDYETAALLAVRRHVCERGPRLNLRPR